MPTILNFISLGPCGSGLFAVLMGMATQRIKTIRYPNGETWEHFSTFLGEYIRVTEKSGTVVFLDGRRNILSSVPGWMQEDMDR